MIDKLKHYSMTNPASVYDEEAMTALELAGRTAKKVNEVIELVETYDSKIEKIPERVSTEVDHYIRKGEFDEAINDYAGDLEQRLDNLLTVAPENLSVMDVEVIDGRYGGNGKTYGTIGGAIRQQYTELKDLDDDKLSARALEYGYRHNFNKRSLWSQGWLSSETGELGTTGSDYNMYIASNYIPETVERVISNGYPMEIFRFSKSNVYLHKLTGRFNDYTFDHASYKYKIHVTNYVDLVSDYDNKKYPIDVNDSDYMNILMVADPIEDVTDTISASAEKLGYKRNLNRRSLWSQGYIYGSTGVDGVDPAGYDYWLYSRSDFLPENVNKIAVDAGYKARLFYYTSSGEFVKNVIVTGVSDELQKGYRYRVDVTTTNNKLGDRHLVNDVWDKVKLLSDKITNVSPDAKEETVSPFKKGVVFKPYVHEFIKCEPDEVCEQIAEIYTYAPNLGYFEQIENEGINDECYETLNVGNPINDEFYINVWRFRPPYYDDETPKILIVGGQHGFEKGSIYGLTKFVNYMLYETVPYILRHAEIIVIPCLNPYGFKYNTYKNGSGVNLNRNYSYSWSKVNDVNSDYYGGSAPFDQQETQILRDFILTEKPTHVIDFHSLGSGNVSNYEDHNVYYACGFTDEYYTKLKNVIRHIIRDFSYYNTGSEILGRYEGFDGKINDKPSLDNWCAYELNTLALTIEGFNGSNTKPSWSNLSANVVAKNFEIILNFLCEFLAEYSRG